MPGIIAFYHQMSPEFDNEVFPLHTPLAVPQSESVRHFLTFYSDHEPNFAAATCQTAFYGRTGSWIEISAMAEDIFHVFDQETTKLQSISNNISSQLSTPHDLSLSRLWLRQ